MLVLYILLYRISAIMCAMCSYILHFYAVLAYCKAQVPFSTTKLHCKVNSKGKSVFFFLALYSNVL